MSVLESHLSLEFLAISQLQLKFQPISQESLTLNSVDLSYQLRKASFVS